MIDTNAVMLFMGAGGQYPSPETAKLYKLLIMEEVAELLDTLGESRAAYHLRQAKESAKDETLINILAADPVQVFHEALDSVWVIVGLMLAFQMPITGGWSALSTSNLAKVDPATGKITRDPQTGKILKPTGWHPPRIRESMIAAGFPGLYTHQVRKGEVYDD